MAEFKGTSKLSNEVYYSLYRLGLKGGVGKISDEIVYMEKIVRIPFLCRRVASLIHKSLERPQVFWL